MFHSKIKFLYTVLPICGTNETYISFCVISSFANCLWFCHIFFSSILTYYIVIKDRSKASFTKDWHNFLNDLNLELPTMFQGFVKKKCLQKWATKWNSRQRRYQGCCCAKKSDAEHYGAISWGMPSKNNFCCSLDFLKEYKFPQFFVPVF